LLSAVADGDFSVNVDDSSIEINADTLRIKADGVTGAMLAPAVAGVGLAQDGSGNLDVDLNELTAAIALLSWTLTTATLLARKASLTLWLQWLVPVFPQPTASSRQRLA
jgi:hypothetical protein